jgi:RHS repeat-associated protein
MAYDLASRLLSRNYFAAGSGIAESTDSFTYDLASRPVTANNADALISYTYDSIGRRSSLTQTVDGLAKTVSFVYDAGNRLLSRSVEGLAVESRNFTTRGQLAQVKLDNQVVADFGYDAVGREISRTYGNGIETVSGYSRADNLITSISVANKPELSLGYSYDSNKNVTAEQRGGSMALYSWNATFDNMDRLNSQNDGVQTRSWTLDIVGNITSETLDGNTEARTLNAMFSPTTAGNKSYTYDNNGQMTSKPNVTLAWDARNHLLQSVKSAPSAPSVDYKYDAFGNRVSKGTTRYLLVDNQVLAEFTGSAAKQYCYGSYIDEVLCEQKSESGVTASLFYHRNRQYNTTALTNSSGAVLEMYSTDAMGRVKSFDAAGSATSPSSLGTNILFTGRVFDAETGLYYFRARYFESELGVFISRDPLGFVDGQSVYQGWFIAFSLDPSGLVVADPQPPKRNVHVPVIGPGDPAPAGIPDYRDHIDWVIRFKMVPCQDRLPYNQHVTAAEGKWTEIELKPYNPKKFIETKIENLRKNGEVVVLEIAAKPKFKMGHRNPDDDLWPGLPAPPAGSSPQVYPNREPIEKFWNPKWYPTIQSSCDGAPYLEQLLWQPLETQGDNQINGIKYRYDTSAHYVIGPPACGTKTCVFYMGVYGPANDPKHPALVKLMWRNSITINVVEECGKCKKCEEAKKK